MIKIPSREECLKILKENNVPENVVRHSLKVAELALDIAKRLKARGINVDISLLEAAAILHDIMRSKKGDHAIEGARFIKGIGYEKVAETAKAHGLYNLPKIKPETTEQKILFYADKRIIEDRIVSLKERFDDFRKRYPDYAEEKSETEYEFVKNIGMELGMEEE